MPGDGVAVVDGAGVDGAGVAVADGLVVEVSDDGRGAAAPYDGRGLGLTGMRERVTAHDGTLETGPRTGGGFAVCARIPL